MNMAEETWDNQGEDGEMRFQVLMAARMKMTAFCDIAPCSLVEVDCVLEVLTASIINTSETLVNFYETAQCNIPKGCHL
jgi:hypothetical protein